MRRVENEKCGKLGVWKMRSGKNEEDGKCICGVWKMRSVKN